MQLRRGIFLKAWGTETRKKNTERDMQLFEELFRMEKNEERDIQMFAPAELYKYLAEFIRSGRR